MNTRNQGVPPLFIKTLLAQQIKRATNYSNFITTRKHFTHFYIFSKFKYLKVTFFPSL